MVIGWPLRAAGRSNAGMPSSRCGALQCGQMALLAHRKLQRSELPPIGNRLQAGKSQ